MASLFIILGVIFFMTSIVMCVSFYSSALVDSRNGIAEKPKFLYYCIFPVMAFLLAVWGGLSATFVDQPISFEKIELIDLDGAKYAIEDETSSATKEDKIMINLNHKLSHQFVEGDVVYRKTYKGAWMYGVYNEERSYYLLNPTKEELNK